MPTNQLPGGLRYLAQIIPYSLKSHLVESPAWWCRRLIFVPIRLNEILFSISPRCYAMLFYALTPNYTMALFLIKI